MITMCRNICMTCSDLCLREYHQSERPRCMFVLIARPSVSVKDTKIEIYEDGNTAGITWNVNNIGSFTRILVEVCVLDTDNCLEHNVTDSSGTSVVAIPQGKTHQFSFFMYDGVDLVSSQPHAVKLGTGMKLRLRSSVCQCLFTRMKEQVMVCPGMTSCV